MSYATFSVRSVFIGDYSLLFLHEIGARTMNCGFELRRRQRLDIAVLLSFYSQNHFVLHGDF